MTREADCFLLPVSILIKYGKPISTLRFALIVYTCILYGILTDRNFSNQQDNQQSSARCKVRNAHGVFANKLCAKRPREQEYGNMLFGTKIKRKFTHAGL